MKFDIAPLVAYAFSVHPETYSRIDSLYRREFDDYIKKTPWKDSRLFTRNTAEVQIYAQKILGISQYISDTKDKDLLIKLKKMARFYFSQYYKFAIRCGPEVPVVQFLSHFNLKYKTGPKSIAIYGMILFFLLEQGVKVTSEDEKSRRFLELTQALLENYSNPIVSNIKKEKKIEVTRMWQTLKDRFGRLSTLNDFTSSPHYEKDYFCHFIEKISDLDSLPLCSIEDEKFSDEDALEIVNIYLINIPISVISSAVHDEKIVRYFFLALVIRSYARKYETAKQKIITLLQQKEEFVNTAAIRADLDAANKKIRNLNKKLTEQKTMINEMKSKLRAKESEIDSFIVQKTENLRQALALKQEHLNESERIRMRLLFENDKLSDEIKRLSNHTSIIRIDNNAYKNTINAHSSFLPQFPSRIASIISRKVIVFGGHLDFIKKLKFIFPEFTYCNSNSSLLNEAIIAKANLLIFCHLHLSHNLYYRAMKCAKKYNVEISFVKCTNQELLYFKTISVYKIN